MATNSPNNFQLHPQLEADCFTVAELTLCRVLLLNDSRYPWLVLVPKRTDIVEVYELTEPEQQLLWQEVTACGKALMQSHSGHKLNIGALGNMVPQLHIHVIVRNPTDEAWPGPVWGVGQATRYSQQEIQQYTKRYSSLFQTEA